MLRYVQTTVLFTTVLGVVKADIGLVFDEWPQWVVVAPGGQAELRCKTNLPSDRLLWLHDHHDLLNYTSDTTDGASHLYHQTPYITTSQDGLGSALHIRLHHRQEVYKKQLGLYQCVAWLGAIAVTSLPGQVQVAVLSEFSGASGNLNLTVEEGQPARIFCPLPDSNPPAEVTFYKNGQLLDVDNKQVYWQAQSGDLVLRQVSSKQAGTYVCSAYNDVLARSVTSSHYTHVHIVTSSPVSESNHHRELITYQDKYVLKTGEKAELVCLVAGYHGNITWRRHEGSIPDAVEYLEDGSLVIPRVEVKDSGPYSCYGAVDVAEGGLIMFGTIQLIIQEPPSVKLDLTKVVKEGADVSIKCEAQGSPAPSIIWVFNGALSVNQPSIKQTGDTLLISPVEKGHAGVYQCFAYNVLGAGQGTAMISVMPNLITEHDMNKNKKTKDLQQNKDVSISLFNQSNLHATGDIMVAPPRPNVTKISDDSVMVSWDTSNNRGIPVAFYKVQYRQVSSKFKSRASKWRTVDEDVPAHVNSLEVTGLKPLNSYRFRLAAVYKNHDNLRGPTSKKFLLKKDIKLQRPDQAPVINKLIEVSPSVVKIKWSYTCNITTEGFLVSYRASSSARDYTKLTVLEENIREYTVIRLDPDISYDFKVQSFNMAGTSDSSEIVSRRVQASSNSSFSLSGPSPPPPTYPPVLSEVSPVSHVHLYMILGVVVALLLIIVLVSFTVYSCRNKTCDDQDPRQYSPCVLSDDTFDLAGHASLTLNNIHVNGRNSQCRYEGITSTTAIA